MNYNNLLYESGPVKFKDYISNKYNDVHNQLYDDALRKYIVDYVSNVLFKDIMYNLINGFNNFIYSFVEDEDEIKPFIDYEKIKNVCQSNKTIILSYDLLLKKYTTIVNPEQNTYFNSYINYLYQNDSPIISILDEIGIDNEYKENYIKYFLINILYILQFTKEELSNVIYNEIHNQKDDVISKYLDISDFIIKYKNSIYISSESNSNNSDEIELFKNESYNNLYIFIYDDMIKNDIHIGYTNSGKIILDIDENINEDELNIDNIINKLSKVITTSNVNLKKIMSQQFIDIFFSTHKIIEVKNSEYWMPSSIIIYNRIYPYTKKIIDLTPYWNTYQDHSDLTLSTIKMTDENILDSQIQSFDYVRGKAQMYSKMNDMNYEIDFDYLGKDVDLSEEMLTDTFTYKYNNL